MAKVLLCRCEDVLASEIEEAIQAGHRDVESIKRYTGFATGVCQGKSCVVHAATLLAAHGVPIESLAPITPRPPLLPLPMRVLAADGEKP